MTLIGVFPSRKGDYATKLASYLATLVKSHLVVKCFLSDDELYSDCLVRSLIVHLVLHASIIFVLIDSCPYADCCLRIRDSRVLECSRPQYSSWATLGLLPYLPVISGDMGRSSCQFPLAIWAFLTKSCQPRSKLASWDLYVEAMVQESCPKSLVVIVKIHSLPLD